MKLWLDDERDPREWLPFMGWFSGRPEVELDEWVWVKTAPEAVALIARGEVDEVSLDHDLGDEEQVGSGYQVLLWIEERAATDDDYLPPVIHIHTSNVGARDRMESAVVGIQNILARRSS